MGNQSSIIEESFRQDILPHGEDIDLIPASVRHRYRCLQCRCTVEKPWQLSCGHRICERCLEQSRSVCVESHEENAEVSIGNLERYRDIAIERDLHSTQINCPVTGCNWFGRYKEHGQHQQRDHGNLVPCPLGCGQTMPEHQVRRHVHLIYGACPERPCPFGCESRSTVEHFRDNIEKHYQSTDPKNPQEVDVLLQETGSQASHYQCKTERTPLEATNEKASMTQQSAENRNTPVQDPSRMREDEAEETLMKLNLLSAHVRISSNIAKENLRKSETTIENLSNRLAILKVQLIEMTGIANLFDFQNDN